MMITTRFGSEIDPIRYTGDGWFRVLRVATQTVHEWHISEFRYDRAGFAHLKTFMDVAEKKSKEAPHVRSPRRGVPRQRDARDSSGCA